MSATARGMTRPSASASPPPPQLGLWARLTRALRWRFGVYRPTDVNGWSDGDVLSLAEDLHEPRGEHRRELTGPHEVQRGHEVRGCHRDPRPPRP